MAQILLVEDEEDLRENIEIVLAHAGHDVTTAGNGRDALTLIERSPPDLILSDISMPVMSGLEMLETVRSRMPALANMPIVLLTAMGEKEHLIQGREAGADDYLTKPVDYQVLMATIDARLARTRQANDLKEKQFVRLFRNLSKAPANATVEPEGPGEPTLLERVAELAEPSLKGRAAVLCPDDFYRAFPALPASTRAKVTSVMARVTRETLRPDDVMIELGAGALLVALATPDRGEASDRFTLLRMRLTQAFGKENLGAGDTEAVEAEEADGAPLGRELKDTLKTLFAHVGHDGHAGEAHTATFQDIAGTIRIDYLPVWNARTETVEAFRLRYRRRVDGALLPESRTLLRGADDPMMCGLQSHLLDAAIRDVLAARAEPGPSRKPPVVIVPLSLPVFEDLNAYRVEQQLADMVRLVDRASVGFHIMHLTDQIPTGLLRHVLALAAAAGSMVVADLDLNDPRLPHLRGQGCHTLHIDDAVARSSGLRRDRLNQALREAIHTAAQAGFEVWVSNVDVSQEGRHTAAAGAVLLSGRIVGDGKPAPERPSRLPASRVFLTV